MSEEMKFPDTLDEFIKQYSFIDEEQIYTNGSELIHTFRVKQWEEHKKQENQELKKQLEEFKEMHKTMARYALDNEAKIDELENQQKEYKQEKQEWINLLGMFKNQQKEFIEYLENEIKRLEEIDESKISQCSITTIRCMKSNYKEILSRYEETIGIIGDKDEKDNNNI